MRKTDYSNFESSSETSSDNENSYSREQHQDEADSQSPGQIFYYRLNPYENDEDFFFKLGNRNAGRSPSGAHDRKRRQNIMARQNLVGGAQLNIDYASIKLDKPEFDLSFKDSPKNLRSYSYICLWTKKQVNLNG